MTDKLGNTDRPDTPVVSRDAFNDLTERMEMAESKLASFEKALNLLIDGLEEQLGVRAGLKDEKREY